MDIFLVQNGIVKNIVVVDSLERAAAMYPEYMLVPRTEVNVHVQIGDAL